MRRFSILFATIALAFTASPVHAKDFLLTIGGGYSPSGNQASIERNVVYYQRVLAQQGLGEIPHHVLFADGDDPSHDVQVVDATTIPEANRLMAEFFGSRNDLGLSYRNHQVTGVKNRTSPATIRDWFTTTGTTMQEGDRLLLYVTAHGNRSTTRNLPYNTTISLWNRQKITAVELSQLLDGLPRGVQVVTFMVQCHAGGFARFLYKDTDANRGFVEQQRVGFFATCLLYTSPSPRDATLSRMPSSA